MKFEYNVNKINSNYDFIVEGVLYAGKPIPCTAVFIGKKVEKLISNLDENCNYLVFIDESIEIPERLLKNILFVKTKKPQYEYAKFAVNIYDQLTKYNSSRKYKLFNYNSYIGENVKIGKNVIIEPNCLIDHDVIIGENVLIKSGAKISNCIIGNNVICRENCVIGSTGFNMIQDDNYNLYRIPTLGDVVIGDNVEIGVMTDISAGTAGSTILENYVKLDKLISIGHDAILHDNVECAGGSLIGAHDEIGERTFVGMGATIKNRLTIGKNCFIGIGTVVIRNVADNTKVFGVPAKVIKV